MKNAPKYSETEILQSADGIKRAQIPEHVWNGILNRIDTHQSVYQFVPRRTIWLGAASLAILLLLNIFSLRQMQHNDGRKSNGLNALIAEYGMVQNQMDFYK